ncbi:hypothetical protein GCM10018952_10680 [Streptosporangium vulgare]
MPTVTGELPEDGARFFGRVGLTTGAVEAFPPVVVPVSAVTAVAVDSPVADAAVAVAPPGVVVEVGDAEAGGPSFFIPGEAGTLSIACLSLAGLQYSAIRRMSALLLVRVIEVIPLGTPPSGVAAALPANTEVMVTQAATSPPSAAVIRRAREDMGVPFGESWRSGSYQRRKG